MYTLESFGSFFIGGKKITVENQAPYQVKRSVGSEEITIDPNGQYFIESTYVQFFIPPKNKSNLLFIHGGGNTGAVWENTPTVAQAGSIIF